MLAVEIVEKASLEGDHQQNGLAEASVRKVKGQAQVLKSGVPSDGCKPTNTSWHGWCEMQQLSSSADASVQTAGCPEQRKVEKRWTKSSVLFGETCCIKPTTGAD